MKEKYALFFCFQLLWFLSNDFCCSIIAYNLHNCSFSAMLKNTVLTTKANAETHELICVSFLQGELALISYLAEHMHDIIENIQSYVLSHVCMVNNIIILSSIDYLFTGENFSLVFIDSRVNFVLVVRWWLGKCGSVWTTCKGMWLLL